MVCSMYIGVCWFTEGFFYYRLLEKSNSLVEWMVQGQISLVASLALCALLCSMTYLH